ncbi:MULTISPECIES: DUF7118 family protein [Salinibaculum]|uniref:DUF7118 family protein n=1 Tax=Salinibaculum TaxID=2732368 RepID=UPI0030CC90AA
MSTSETVDDPVAALQRADERLARARQRVDEFGEADLRQLADAYDEFTGLLNRYEEPATGDGDFQKFIEFQGKIESAVERLADDILLREAFEEADEHLQQRRLSESDFAYVREQLEPVADLVGRLDERDDALAAYRRARRRVEQARHETSERIDDLERLVRLGEADLDAPTERLRDPIGAYNDAVQTAWREFRRDAPAREVVAFLDSMGQFPLVPFETPPSELREYVRERPPGEKPVPKLLEYADYSRSKLDHYVDDPAALTRAVGTRQTYLQRLDADPLTVDWPPPTAEELEFRTKELTAAVNRFAPDVVEHLRAVAALPRETEYRRLRESAVAEADLTDGERERLKSGAVEDELADARERLERLETGLSEYPEE